MVGHAGDMLLLSTLDQRQAVLDLVRTLQSEGWRPGASLRTEE